jgi:uncharacterized protein with HEPN domain
VRDSRERLLDMLEAIGDIERYASRGRSAFDTDELLQTWVVRHLQIIGEAARVLPSDVQGRAPDIAWSEIIGMRNILVHHYFDVDTDVVWRVIERDLPRLKTQIERLIESL